MAENEERFDKEAVRRALPWFEFLCQRQSIELQRSGHVWKAVCPFHAERTGSFTINVEKGTGHCFGCAWHGDEFAFFASLEGLDLKGQFAEILRRMAGIAGLAPMPDGYKPPAARPVQRKPVVPAKVVKWPRLRPLSDATCEELATLRGLDVAGVMAARDAGFIWGNACGVRSRGGQRVWDDELQRDEERNELRLGPLRCWLVADRAGYVMQARRLDGVKWERWDKERKEHVPAYKADTISIEGGASWPVGAAMIGERRCVALVEGGPDILAAFHFLAIAGRLKDVAVVSILGGAMRIHEEARQFFAHKRVRIFAHYDEIKNPNTGKREGWEAAARWTDQLTEAGAEVDVWDFEGLLQSDGQPVGDLNDAARGDVECLAEMRPAMDFQPSIFDIDGR